LLRPYFYGFIVTNILILKKTVLCDDKGSAAKFYLRLSSFQRISRLKPGRKPFPCQLYELTVSEPVYKTMRNYLNCFVKSKPALSYTKLGVLFRLLTIPYKRRSRYFCSFFVAEVLSQCNATRLRKDSALYLPGDFRKLPGVKLKFQGDLQSLMYQFQFMTALPCATN